MSGPEISNMKNQFWAVGRWSGLDCEIKGSGPIMSNFFGLFFHFFGVKIFFLNFFENTIASALKRCIEKRLRKKYFFWEDYFFQKKHFILGLKFEWNLSVNTWWSGTDYCWLYCAKRQRTSFETLFVISASLKITLLEHKSWLHHMFLILRLRTS